MKIVFSLSDKVVAFGRREILLTAQMRVGSKVCRMRAKSDVFVEAAFFSPDKGVDMSRRRLITPDAREWHIEAQKKLADLLAAIAMAEGVTSREQITKDWLRDTIDAYYHPKKEKTEAKKRPETFFTLMAEYLRQKEYSEYQQRGFEVLARAVARYEGYVQATQRGRRRFKFAVNDVTREEIERFRDYLREEKALAEGNPALFKKLLEAYPADIRSERSSVEARGGNTVQKMLKRLKTFFKWLYETKRTINRPFDGIILGTEKYGTPYYLTTEERDRVADLPVSDKRLAIQRDIFTFHCLVGCRVSDLMRLSADNIRNGILEYTPRKTKDEGGAPAVARVPLLPRALALLEKYRDVDRKGRLFPFITPQRYNDAIKKLLELAGITRMVDVRDSLTGEIVHKPINEVASSHMARRTFVGNLYQQVQDPNLIGKMSGHVEGSTAFARYRKIEDDTLRQIIEKIK